jgi:uncharacterized protein YndB with AHSA1/START domain
LNFKINPKLDLVLERTIDVPRGLVWKAWTEPEHLMPWFCPLPWKAVECEIDLRPGGIFRTVMRGPEGQKISGGAGCWLEVVKNEKLVWTSALHPGYRPVHKPVTCGEDMVFTAIILLEPHGSGTKYTAIAIHGDEESSKKHVQMGFHEGWGKALDQLVDYVKKM